MKVEASAEAVHAAAVRPSWMDRRLPQLLGAYLAGAWTGFQFVQWLTDRFVLSPHVEDAYLLLLLFVTPSVVLLAYRHGARGRQPWTRYEKVGIPCNLLGAVALLAVLFGGKDLGSAREVVTVVGADGETIERAIPKSAFRKRVAVFTFDDATAVADDAWLALGLPLLIDVDLSQEPFLEVASPRSFQNRLQQAGFDTPESTPLALQRQIARETRYGFVLTGRVARADGGYRLEARLIRAETGKQIAAHAFAGASILGLVDQLTSQLKVDFELPRKHIEETPDLPVEEVMSASIPALRAYVESVRLTDFLHNPEAARTVVERALTLDPTFAFAHLQHYQLLNMQGLQQEALAALARTQQHDYRLPEPTRFALKAWSFFLNKQPEAALRAAQQWHTFYPDDVHALGLLVELHRMRNEVPEAVAALRRIEALDPDEARALEIGDLLRGQGRLDEASAEYERYVARFPERQDGYRRLGSIHRERGDLDAEAEAYARALVAEPDDPSIPRSQAEVAFRQGRFDDARRFHDAARLRARTPREQASNLWTLSTHQWLAGDHAAYLTTIDSLLAVNDRAVGAASAMMSRTMLAWTVARAGAGEWAEEMIGFARAHPAYGTNDMLDLNVDLGQALLDYELGRTIDRPALVAQAQRLMDDYGLAGTNVAYYEGLLALRTGAFAAARDAFERQLAVSASGSIRETSQLGLGQALAALGETARAREAFGAVLRTFPSHPEAHLGLARLALRSDPTAARAHLERALATWSAAAPRHAEAAEARALLAELR